MVMWDGLKPTDEKTVPTKTIGGVVVPITIRVHNFTAKVVVTATCELDEEFARS